MNKVKIISASSTHTLNKQIQEMIAEGWEPVGSHSAVTIHAQNRYAGSQHMDTRYETEYSITMRMTINEPKIETGIYWYEDEITGGRVYDEDSMREEFETKLNEILK